MLMNIKQIVRSELSANTNQSHCHNESQSTPGKSLFYHQTHTDGDDVISPTAVRQVTAECLLHGNQPGPAETIRAWLRIPLPPSEVYHSHMPKGLLLTRHVSLRQCGLMAGGEGRSPEVCCAQGDKHVLLTGDGSADRPRPAKLSSAQHLHVNLLSKSFPFPMGIIPTIHLAVWLFFNQVRDKQNNGWLAHLDLLPLLLRVKERDWKDFCENN